MKCSYFGAVALLLPLAATAAEPGFPRVAPTPPERAEQTFEVQHGFAMQLIAAEPLVVDPVDLAYDENGRAYVVEMRDYPYPEEKNAAPTEFPGTVRLLEDDDGDGRFDQSWVFADQLAWPTSVACWQGGVFVAAAPDIWYFKDTDGDRRADIRRKVFTGFGRYNVQAIMNNLRLGLDGWIYGAAAGNGGSVRHAERKDAPPLALSRRDFRFHPVTEEIEGLAGGQRYGNAFDDWGNRFVCNIRNPVQHVVVPLVAVARNPQFAAPSLVHDAAEAGDQLRVFRLSPPEPWRTFRAQRWALELANLPRSELIGAGYWTSSSGVRVYRGGAYPPAFRGNVFIGEVAGNLVHRQTIEPDGVTFKSRRADENTEFVRSRDNWFRPVNFVNAPDGTLHVLDMYRETIEHPWSIPDDIKAQLDLSSGNDRGRIYRLAPPSFTVPQPPKLRDATTAELVEQLSSPHSWWRETAGRLLLERRDPQAAPALKKLLQESENPLPRLHAMYLLDSLELLDEAELRAALADATPGIVRHAVLLAEKRLADSAELQAAVRKAAGYSDAQVRFQVAIALGAMPAKAALPGLVQLAERDAGDAWLRIGILSSSAACAGELTGKLLSLEHATAGHIALVEQLAATVGARGEAAAMSGLLAQVVNTDAAKSPELVYAALAGLGQGADRRRQKLTDVKLGDDDAARLRSLLAAAVERGADRGKAPAERLPALALLALFDWDAARPVLLACLDATEPREVQLAALRHLATFNEMAVAGELLSRWKQFTPPLREEAVTTLLSRPAWHEPLVAALEAGRVPPSQVSPPQRARLAALPDAALATRAGRVLQQLALGPRKDVVGRYQGAFELTPDRANGAVVYRRECAACHRLGREGHDVGPNLATIEHRSPAEILIHVLDPNREVSPNFLDYTVRLTDGRILTGLLAEETDAGLTLRRGERREDTVLRSEIEEMITSGKSLMPEGLEQKITPQEMADLIGFLRSPTTTAASKP